MILFLRKKIRYILFKNNNSVLVNLLYLLYERAAKKKWIVIKHNDIEITNYVNSFKSDGFLFLNAPSKFTHTDLLELQKKVNQEFKNSDNIIALNNGLIKLVDGLKMFPNIINFIDAEIETIIESFFRSHFKIYSVSFYRITPTKDNPDASFLWHTDNCPKQEIKLMIYLDDVDESLGAFSIKNKSTSDFLTKKGFNDRKRNEKFIDIINDNATTTICEGKTGSRLLFQNGKCIHKATSPKHEHRDVANLVIIPSLIPWRSHYARNKHLLSTNAGVCLNPFNDKPELIGYRY